MRWAGHVACMGDNTSAYSVLVGRQEGKRPLSRRRLGWKNNMKIDLQEEGWGPWTRLIWLSRRTGGGRL
jgi:hypothetical protein